MNNINKKTIVTVTIFLSSLLLCPSGTVANLERDAKTFCTNNNVLKYVFDEPKLDQYQNETNNSDIGPFGVLPPPDNEIKLAQSFKPSYSILSKIEILLEKKINSNPVQLSIKESLNITESLITIQLNNSDISNYPTWTTVDFPDINVTPQKTYYIICSTTASAALFIYNWHFGGNNYERGVAYDCYNGTWSFSDLDMYDFCFRTYGINNNTNPVANFSWTPENPKINQTITFNASTSYDPDGTIILYKWDWNNDGTFEESYPTPLATHAWNESGSHPVTLQVLDNMNASGNTTKNVNIYDIIVPDDYPTIQKAIDNSQVGYDIYVRPGGTYKENLYIDIESIQLQGGNSLNTTIDGQGIGPVITISEMSYNTEISGFTIKNSGIGYDGIIMQSYYNDIHDNNIITNGFGVDFQHSSGNEIVANNFQNNGNSDAISIRNGSFASVISNNTMIQNQQNGIGIYIDNFSDGHLIQYNTISGYNYGIKIDGASKGTVVCENIISNNKIGVGCVFFSDGNRFFYNTLKKNNVNAYDASIDRWDNNATGNYWDDYTGHDNDSNGIGDTPYPIPGGENKDRYPLMYPWGPPTTPISPVGIINGKQGKEYNYSTMSTDPYGVSIKYGWDWNGDGTVEEWTPYYASGEMASITHKYTKGNYRIQVIAKNIHNQLSNWSNPINVSITRSFIYDTLSISKDVNCYSSLLISRFKTLIDHITAYTCKKLHMLEKKQPLLPNAKSLTIYVPRDYPTIQKAINNSHDSDIIIVSPGTYHEHLVVNKQLTINGTKGKRDSTIIDGDNIAQHIITIVSNKVTIQNFTIKNCPGGNNGIYIIRTNDSTISNNNFSNCGGAGVDILEGLRNMINFNLIFNNNLGVIFSDCSSCTIFNNTIKNNIIGVELLQQNYSKKTSNQLEKNFINKNAKEGILLTHVDTVIVGNNSISQHSGNRTVDIYYVKNMRFFNNTCSQNAKDVCLDTTSGSTFINNNINYLSSILEYSLPNSNPIVLSSEKGVNIINSNGNLFYHNNFNDKLNIFDQGGKNIYNVSKSRGGGNYWNDYTGKDWNHDGFGDTKYSIPNGNVKKQQLIYDYLPLMKPWP
jgi:nitrous oxidase accessory protein NosD